MLVKEKLQQKELCRQRRSYPSLPQPEEIELNTVVKEGRSVLSTGVEWQARTGGHWKVMINVIFADWHILNLISYIYTDNGRHGDCLF